MDTAQKMTHRSGSPIPSPCISLCKMNRDTGYCEGCWRTIDEIIEWASANNTTKERIWQKIMERRSGAYQDPNMPTE